VRFHDRGQAVQGVQRADIAVPADSDVVGTPTWRGNGVNGQADVWAGGVTAPGASLTHAHEVSESSAVDEALQFAENPTGI
jgi:hypothetical protein